MSDPEYINERLHVRAGEKYAPGKFQGEAVTFLRQYMSAKDFETIMRSSEGQKHPYVAARVFLSSAEWEKYVWIEHHGSLDGFSERETDRRQHT